MLESRELIDTLEYSKITSASIGKAMDEAEETEVEIDAVRKILSDMKCGALCKFQSDMVFMNDGYKACWQAKIFGWCTECMECSDSEFKTMSRRTGHHRASETKGLRERAYDIDFKNASRKVREMFPDVSTSIVRELTVKRHRAMCLSFACAFDKENVH